jgi:hypothetical protein
VTRLGKVSPSPSVLLFSLSSAFKLLEKATFWGYYILGIFPWLEFWINFDTKCVGLYFFTNSSGHPAFWLRVAILALSWKLSICFQARKGDLQVSPVFSKFCSFFAIVPCLPFFIS